VVVICGDTAAFFRELDELRTEGQRLVGVLDPELLWLSHQHEPWRPQVGSISERDSEASRPGDDRLVGWPACPVCSFHRRSPAFPAASSNRSLLATSMIANVCIST
jgi:hypothetical protein